MQDWLSARVVESNPVLWEGLVASDQVLTIGWDVSSASVTVHMNGEQIPAVMVDDPSGRPTWRTIDSDLSGFVDVDEATGLIVLQVELAGTYHRMHASVPGLGGVATDPVESISAAPSTCVCFGLGGGGGSCSDKNCDEGAGCGTGHACRWKSGGVAY